MTPRQFSLLVKRYERRLKLEDRRAGGIIATLRNIHFRSEESDPVLDWQDVFPEWKELQEPLEPIPEQTEDQMFETMKLLAASTGGLEPST